MNYLRLGRLPWIDVPPYDQILIQLMGSCQDSGVSLLCLQGPNGSGKSRLLLEFLSCLALDETIGIIEINGKTNGIVYHNIEHSAQIIKLQKKHCIETIKSSIDASLDNHSSMYILIDDAEYFSSDVMTALHQSISENPDYKNKVSMVLCMGIISIEPDVQALLKQANIITIPGMTMTQSKVFVDNIYAHVQDNYRISVSDANQLHNLSYGYPGRLIKLMQQKSTPQNQKHTRFNALKLFAGMLSVALIIGIVWMRNDSDVPQPFVEAPLMPIQKEIIHVKKIDVTRVLETQSDLSINASSIPNSSFWKSSQKYFERELVQTPIEIAVPTVVEQAQNKVKTNYVIELARHSSKAKLEEMLKGRSIPGKTQFKQIKSKGINVWVAYIGPYGDEEQAKKGKKALPASLQALPLQVIKEL